MALTLTALLALLHPSVVGIWQLSGWFFGVGAIFAYGLAVLFLLETFVRQTWITNTGIHQRSLLGQTRFIPHEQIKELVIERGEALVVKYRENLSIKVHAKESDPEEMIEMMRKFLDPNIRVLTI